MNKRELKKFQKLLLAERERLLEGVTKLKGDVLYRPMSDRYTADPSSAAEVGTDSFERETALRVVGTESEELYEIEEALKRIEDGSYGVCLGTGEAIPSARLEAFPAARYCIQFQEEIEKMGRA